MVKNLENNISTSETLFHILTHDIKKNIRLILDSKRVPSMVIFIFEISIIKTSNLLVQNTEKWR